MQSVVKNVDKLLSCAPRKFIHQLVVEAVQLILIDKYKKLARKVCKVRKGLIGRKQRKTELMSPMRLK